MLPAALDRDLVLATVVFVNVTPITPEVPLEKDEWVVPGCPESF